MRHRPGGQRRIPCLEDSRDCGVTDALLYDPARNAFQRPRPRESDPTLRRSIPLSIVSALVAVVLSAPVPIAAAGGGSTIAAAGDIACPHPCSAQRSTTRLIQRLNPTAVLALGDNQYQHGALKSYRRSYRPTWGRFQSITNPVPGNHDYETRGARGYYRYFGAPAHRRTGGYYSYDMGAWHFVALNSEVRTRAETRWLRRDLHADGHECELAYWHEPRFSSGVEHGGTRAVAGWWRILYRAGVDVVLNGHEHNYERFARLSPGGRKRRRGIREFVVGTGGGYLYRLGRPVHGSERRLVTHGVLSMELGPTRYRWRFIKTGGGVGDRGRTSCHR
jgi:acid phosphatase type 7